MRKLRFILALTAACLVLALPAAADEYDFVGYEYQQDYSRDYTRGFFFGAEAWFADAHSPDEDLCLLRSFSPWKAGKPVRLWASPQSL